MDTDVISRWWSWLVVVLEHWRGGSGDVTWLQQKLMFLVNILDIGEWFEALAVFLQISLSLTHE